MRLAYVLALVLALLLLSGCAGIGGRKNDNIYTDPERARYYTGREGVEAEFTQLPPRLFYYGDAPGSTPNEFDFAAEVANRGASYSRGAVFVSGYDPNIIEIDEIPIASAAKGACSMRLGDYTLNGLGLVLQCGRDFQYIGGDGNWFRSIKVRGQKYFGDSWLKNINLDFSHFRDAGNRIDVTWDGQLFGFEMREHGLQLIAILAGLDFEIFLGQEYILAGDTYDYPGGEIDFTTYNARFMRWPEGVDSMEQHFLLTNCYLYTTFAAPMVCIDPQPYSENRKVCRPFSSTWSGGQGAPVAITKIIEEPTPRHAIFHITVKNVGGGTVYDPGSLEKCSPYYPGGALKSDLDRVWIGIVRIGNTEITDQCTPNDRMIRLQNGQAEFTCRYPIEFAELNSAYETPLVVELWYGYSTVKERIIPIKRIT